MSVEKQAGANFGLGTNPGPSPGCAAPGAAARVVLAPCGIDCRLCSVYQRKRKPCPGCGGPDAEKPAHCVQCAFVLCVERPAGAASAVCRAIAASPSSESSFRSAAERIPACSVNFKS